PFSADGTWREAAWESRSLRYDCSREAQWWSTRLLTGRLEVRVLSLEPFNAEVAELADAQDLKSCGPSRSYRFDSGLRHHFYRGVEQLVARRAHNPKVVGSSPAPATIMAPWSSGQD